MVERGSMKLARLRRRLPPVNGIVLHDAFGRVFSLIDAKGFAACFIGWMRQRCPALHGRLASVDGRSVDGSHEGGCGRVQLVSAWRRGAGPVSGQRRKAAGSTAITALPELLDAIDLRGITVTIDAVGGQHATAGTMVEKAGFLLAVKDDQPMPAQGAESPFAEVQGGLRDGRLSHDTTVGKGHGRIETRQCVVARDVAHLAEAGLHRPGLRGAVVIESFRERLGTGAERGRMALAHPQPAGRRGRLQRQGARPPEHRMRLSPGARSA